MSNSFYDLDLSFPGDEPDAAKLPVDLVRAAIATMPESLAVVAQAILVEKRTMSDLSQELGIRQGELVSRLQRAQLAIGMFMFQQQGGRH
jgi:DNA-directed RNA polymerase specialized sigma24 family protein